MSTKEEKGGQGLRTVQRALDILNCFDEEQSELSLTEFSNKLGLAKSTTTRLLSTLEQNDFIEKDHSTLKYKLGKKIYYLGFLAGQSIELKNIAKPIMEELRNETKETVNLHILEGYQRVCLEQYKGLSSISHFVKIGKKYPLSFGSGGKAILAFQNENFIKKVLESENNIKVFDELNQIQSDFSCYSIDEEEIGSSAVSAPIFDVHGTVKASLSIAGPTIRFTQEKINEYRKLVKSSAFTISSKMGYIKQQ
ncbi:IclR family transcriptional regulator [Scopulibacillus cellulosilyticus]|uniref:IclR family transcriptional regulator n=1 Tax=Scopulibacillus cellulosilyticus TaxID=2665665 RepID=A0ABW2PVS4_9BACL